MSERVLQQAEIEGLTERQKPTAASGYKVENGKVVFYTNMLEGCRNEYESLDEVVKTLNALLRECYDKDEIAFHLRSANKLKEQVVQNNKDAKIETIKEFAGRLKATIAGLIVKSPNAIYKGGMEDALYYRMPTIIDQLVKEMTEGDACDLKGEDD